MTGFTGLAVPGPTNMPFRIRQAMDVPLEDHRAPDFPEFVIPLMQDLKKIFRTENGHAITFTGSGTSGWEAAIANTLSPGDKVLTTVFGQFSMLWAQMGRDFGLDVQVIDEEWGNALSLEKFHAALKADTAHSIKALFVCHNETATGVTSDIAGVRRILDDLDHPALLFVDGVSSIGSLDFRMDDWGVDVAVAGSQKGFMMPTGLAIVGVSQKAMKAAETAKMPRSFFDFRAMLDANASGYFPYTPATTLLRGLRASVDMLLEEGLDNVAARHHRLASGVRAAVAAWGLRPCANRPDWNSDTVTAILVPPQFDANDVVSAAYHDFGMSLGGGLSKVAGKVFRIGHLGHLNEIMVLQALGGAELAMRRAGIPFQAGAGVGAAVEAFADQPSAMCIAAE